MAIYLNPDSQSLLGGVTVNSYLLTSHNPNGIAMPQTSMDGRVIGVTIHNTDWIIVSDQTTPAEQYTRATVNGNMNDVRVHYYVDDKCAWQNLPLTLSGWHAADGNGNGNRRTIAIECIMSSAYDNKDKKSEDNCARMAAALLRKYGLTIDNLYTHTYWMNVRDGKTGTVDELNVMQNRTKMCPAYILPHWYAFKERVKKYMDDTGTIYRVRKSWADAASQTGAYTVIANAVNNCGDGYSVFDSDGNLVYKKNGQPIGVCPYPVPAAVVRVGSVGDPARWVQWHLTSRGYYCGASGVDGDFGAATERGLIAYQKVVGLEADGVCGPATKQSFISTAPEQKPDGDGDNSFKPRLTKPANDNKYYIRRASGGYATAIQGYPKDPYLDVLSNCVGYAHSRFHEIANNPKMNLYDPVNAENTFANAKAHGLEVGTEPRLGAIMVWQKGATLSGSDGAGHVAIVEQINEDGTVITSESGYGCSNPFWTSVRRAPWPNGSGYKFLGFVYNPAVKK